MVKEVDPISVLKAGILGTFVMTVVHLVYGGVVGAFYRSRA